MAFRLQLWSPMSGHAITLQDLVGRFQAVKKNGCDDVQKRVPTDRTSWDRNNYGQEAHL